MKWNKSNSHFYVLLRNARKDFHKKDAELYQVLQNKMDFQLTITLLDIVAFLTKVSAVPEKALPLKAIKNVFTK